MRNRKYWFGAAAVVVVLVVIALIVVGLRRSSSSAEEGGGDSGGKPAAANAQKDKLPTTGLPVASAKQPPAEQPFNGCPSQGDGGDPVLNQLKNRTDTADWIPVQFDALEKLAWPKAAERTRFNSWAKDVRAEIDKYDGIPVSIEGYLFNAQQQGPESNNCHAVAPSTDYHIWLTAAAGQDRTGSIVVEVTPRVRASHPKWTVDALRGFAHNNERVRISGWTMFDPEHPDQVTKTRGTIWEIHPVMKIEVMRNGQWQNLDDLK